MKVSLVQHKLQMVLEDSIPFASTTTVLEKADILERAYSIIFLYLSNSVMRQVSGADTTYKARNKMDNLYLTKLLTN